MEKELASLMFDMLSKRIGSYVTCKVWQFGELNIVSGMLTEVVPFERVTIDNHIISFVGVGQAIESITKGDTENIIYVNPRSKGYNVKDTMGVVHAQEEMLGYSILMEELQGNKSKTVR